MEVVFLSGSHSFSRSCSFLVEGIPFSGKPFLQMELIFFIGSHSLKSKLFSLADTFPFSEIHLVQWKPCLLEQVLPFAGNHSTQWKPTIQQETIVSVDIIHFMEVVSPLSGGCFSMVEAILFSGDYSLQWKPSFQWLIIIIIHSFFLKEGSCLSKNLLFCEWFHFNKPHFQKSLRQFFSGYFFLEALGFFRS